MEEINYKEIMNAIHEYIAKTPGEIPLSYTMKERELRCLLGVALLTPADALVWAFRYGRAKGMRLARATNKPRKGVSK